ncbi:MAG: response regulator [Spirochaetia bacterium]|nr:response regulator [Spirochaetia bacterium]
MEKNNENPESEKILVIEDDEVQALILTEFFQKLGYNVRSEQDGEKGFQTALSWKPDIMLLDVYLPLKNGFDILEDIKSAPGLEYTIIVMMSADTSEDTTIIGLLKQADDFIYKPVRTSELALKLRQLVDRKNNRVALDILNRKLLAEKEILSHYFSDDVVTKIVENQETTRLSGENLVASILFFDIRNFTSISEKLKPNLVADLLNLIFTDVMDLILSHEGSVNKLIGDAILATFGCPFNSEKDAYNAVKCALAISNTIDFFNKVRPSYLEDDIKIGIGITTGEVFAGNIGSYRRMEYTVIGDVVNTASRLQNLTKKTSVNILIDGVTRNAVKERLKCRRVVVKGIRGKVHDVEIFTLEGFINDEAMSETREDLTYF